MGWECPKCGGELQTIEGGCVYCTRKDEVKDLKDEIIEVLECWEESYRENKQLRADNKAFIRMASEVSEKHLADIKRLRGLLLEAMETLENCVWAGMRKKFGSGIAEIARHCCSRITNELKDRKGSNAPQETARDPAA